MALMFSYSGFWVFSGVNPRVSGCGSCSGVFRDLVVFLVVLGLMVSAGLGVFLLVFWWFCGSWWFLFLGWFSGESWFWWFLGFLVYMVVPGSLGLSGAFWVN